MIGLVRLVKVLDLSWSKFVLVMVPVSSMVLLWLSLGLVCSGMVLVMVLVLSFVCVIVLGFS